MLIPNTEIQVRWTIPPVVKTYVYTVFDVIVNDPDGNRSYIESAILEANYTAPTYLTSGDITYLFTANTTGLWTVILTLGTSVNSELYSEQFLQVHKIDSVVNQQVKLG